jgi:hypothetical protein
MSLGGHVGIDPDANGHLGALLLRDDRQPVELLHRFDVEMSQAGPHRLTQLRRGFPHPAEHDALRRKPRRQRSRHLAARHDIGSRPQVAQQPEYGERTVGLHGVADAVRHVRQRGVERTIPLPDGRRVVDVYRRSHLAGDVRQGHAGHEQCPAPPLEPGVGEPAVGQYALAHTASVTLGRPHHMQVFGTSGDRNSSSGSTRIVALVLSLTSASHSWLPQKPAYTNPPLASM